MAPATEIATSPVAAGTTIEDPSSAAGKVWQSTLETVSSQPGFQRAYYGRKIEDQSVVQLFVDWDSYESHQDFIKSSIYGPFSKHFMTVVDGPISMLHVNFDPHPPSAAVSSTSSPVTEVLTCYFKSEEADYDARVKQMIGVMKENAEGFTAASGGWIIEDVEHESIGPDSKGKAFLGVIGWQSKEAHMKFRDSDTFKENIHLVRDGTASLELHHTIFKER